jgi:RHS repeat-associated protein
VGSFWSGGGRPIHRRFTGQRWEQGLGLYDYRARFYDPTLGRFLQPDPIVPEPGNPQALNRYAYVYNNPLRYTDPSGHWLETLWDIASIAWDLYEIRKDPRNLWNWGALAVDIAAAALPLVPGGVGAVVHGSRAARAAAHADEAARLAHIAAWLDRFAGAGSEVIRGVERLAKLVENERVPAQLRNGLAAELARAEEYFKAGKLQAVEAVIESGRVDLILVTGEMVEVKELISKLRRPVVVYSVSGQPAWEGKADGVSGVDG